MSLRLSLSQKAGLVFAVVITAVSGAQALWNARSTTERLEADLQSQAHWVAESQARALVTAVWNMNGGEAEQIIGGLSEVDDFIWARVVEANGDVMAEVGTAHADDRVIEASQPIVRNGEELAIFELQYSRAGIEEAAATSLTNDAIGALVTLVIMLVLVTVVLRTVLRPVIQLTGTMKQLAAGDGSTPIDHLDRQNEIGDMARAIAVFRDNLAQMDKLRGEREEADRRSVEEVQRTREGLADQFQASVKHLVANMAEKVGEARTLSTSLKSATDDNAGTCSRAAASASSISDSFQSVASATEQLSSSVREIAEHIDRSSEITGVARTRADQTQASVGDLNNSSRKIGEVVTLISSIAEQTNLLALNATIEAARAGEAGRGFAVVANEVKNLAAQTQRATQEIETLVDGIQAATTTTVDDIAQIVEVIGQLSEIATTIASAVAEQDSSTGEIARSVRVASDQTVQMAGDLTEVETQSAGNAGRAETISTGIAAVSDEFTTLNAEVDRFLDQVRSA